MATLEKLQARIAKLQTQAEALAAKQSSGVIAKIRDMMERYDLTIADIEAHVGGARKRGRKPGVKIATGALGTGRTKSAAGAKGKLPPKYRDPKTGATWSGHARPPQWIAGAKDRTKFLIDGSSVVSNVEAVKRSKAAAKATGEAVAKGKLPPKYRNPETGETWSGHARPPAWIKDVKDRDAFLIAASQGATAPKAAAARKAPAKKAAAKKLATKTPATRKATANKPVAKKLAVKRVAPTARKATAGKPAIKKSAATKAAAKKVVARKRAASAIAGAQAPAAVTETASVPTSA
ncbi:H-NS family nucleoid-associated regulatory protein [Paraburkholderia diazotrophica]|uniref:DNA-binding protein H-NS n=1 Tax=Paraburkholderia diazotrophica TaxID=667676 RepID=A0A1H7EPQ5_9BURK|nr:H-NS family nucleoid-associated regulatory protein [Paraburkholderia diazotrophica]SEK13640.1 DNA-binding protein H-NS [Paraburkholderia diazotrophica]